MKTIRLNNGTEAIVDDVDYPTLSQYRWHGSPLKIAGVIYGYYARRLLGNKSRKTFGLMHREILGALPGFQVDHINGDTLDNRRSNIRIATTHQNMANQRHHRDSQSPYKGLSWDRDCKKWKSRVCHFGKQYYLGVFSNPLDAARAYDKKATELFGAFAKLNFPETDLPSGAPLPDGFLTPPPSLAGANFNEGGRARPLFISTVRP